MSKKKESQALVLVRHVWDNVLNDAPNHSWERINHSMRAAVDLAITAGLEFDLGDFRIIDGHFKMWYWGGDDGCAAGTYGERFYGMAVRYGNMSAVHSFEHWRGREPFICDRLVGLNYHPDNIGRRKHGRLYVGMRFYWPDKNGVDYTVLKVTSFEADQSYIIACSYTGQRYPAKIRHLYKITHDDIRAEKKARRDFAKAQKEKP